MIKALLYGSIGYQVRAKEVVQWLIDNEKKEIEMHISSPGGDVFEALSIRNAIINHPNITLVVDSIAASAAAVISLCGKPLKMDDYSQLMIHSASTFAGGNKKAIEKSIKMLESIDEDLADAISEKMGKTKDEIKALYFDGNDHWIKQKECVENGIAEAYKKPKTKKEDGTTTENEMVQPYFNCIFGTIPEDYNKHKIENIMLEKFQTVSAFKECKTEDAIIEKANGLVNDLANANKTISERDAKIADIENKLAEAEKKVAEYETERQRVQDEADEKVITDAVAAKKCTEDQANIYRAMLKTDRENTLKLVNSLAAPSTERVDEYINHGNGGEYKMSAMEKAMAEIAERNK